MMSPRRKGSWEPSWAEKSNWACTNLGLLTWRKVEGRGWWGERCPSLPAPLYQAALPESPA